MVKNLIRRQRLKRAKNVDLYDVADALRIHPRTILRTLTGNPTEYWAPKHNPPIALLDVSRIFSIPVAAIRGLLLEEDEALSPREAAALMRVSARTLANNRDKYTPLAVGKGWIRYSKSDIEMWHAERQAAGKDRLFNLF